MERTKWKSYGILHLRQTVVQMRGNPFVAGATREYQTISGEKQQ